MPNIKRKSEDDIITVRAIIRLDNRLLVHYFPKFKTYLTLGGHIHKDEDLWEGLLRELKEESGLILKAKPRDPDYVIFNNHYYIIEPDDIDYVVDATDPDNGTSALVTPEEFRTANELSMNVPIIYSDYLALKQLP